MRYLGVLLYLLVMILSLTGLAFYHAGVAEPDYTTPVVLVMAFLGIYIFNIIYWAHSKKFIITPESFFVGFFSLFHFSYIVLYFTGFSDYDHEVFYDHRVMDAALYYSLICVCLFILAYRAVSLVLPVRINDYQDLVSESDQHWVEYVYRFSIVMLAVALLLFWIPVIPVYSLVFSDYRALISIGEISPLGRFFWLSQYVGYCSISLYLIAKHITGRRITAGYSILLVYFYMASFLITGDRGGFISYLFIFIFAYALYGRGVTLKKVVVYAALLLIVSSVVAVGRSQSIFNPIDMLIYYIESKEESSFVSALNEFGSSLKTVVVAIFFVPEKYDFWYGKSFVDSLLIVIPNPFSYRVSSSVGVFITEAAFGAHGTTHGRGGSIAMEAYVNFGYFGALLFAIYGFYLRYIYARLILSPSLIRGVLFFSSLGAFSMWMRNSSGVTFRIVIWSLVVSYIVILLSRQLGKKTSRRIAHNG